MCSCLQAADPSHTHTHHKDSNDKHLSLFPKVVQRLFSIFEHNIYLHNEASAISSSHIHPGPCNDHITGPGNSTLKQHQAYLAATTTLLGRVQGSILCSVLLSSQALCLSHHLLNTAHHEEGHLRYVVHITCTPHRTSSCLYASLKTKYDYP